MSISIKRSTVLVVFLLLMQNAYGLLSLINRTVLRNIGSLRGSLGVQSHAFYSSEALNTIFLRTYNTVKQEIHKTVGQEIPVLIHKGDDLVLLRNGKTTTKTYVPHVYHDLKAFGHISCGIHSIVMLKKLASDHPDIERAGNDYLSQLSCIIDSVEFKDNTSPLRSHMPLLRQYQALLHRWQRTQDVDQLSKELAQLLPLLQPLIKDAARVRLEALHEQVKMWRKEMPSDQWNNLAVIVMGPQMPRVDELSMQYFKSIFQSKVSTKKISGCPYEQQIVPTQSQRIIYAEAIEKLSDAINLLVTHMADEQVGQAILHDRLAMHRDVLGDSVKDLLKDEKWRI